MIDEALVHLTNRTLIAFALGDGEQVQQLSDTWAEYTTLDVLSALSYLCGKLKGVTIPGAAPDALGSFMIVNSKTGEANPETAPLGIRAGARMLAAGFNGDMMAVRDNVISFVELCTDEDVMAEQCGLLFTTVFAGAAAIITAERPLDAERN